jgi:hypothetical protein
MRIVICVLVLVVLLLVGFLATPGIFQIVNPDYWLAQREYGGQIAKVVAQMDEDDTRIAALQSKISNLERSLSDMAVDSTAAILKLKTENASQELIITSQAEFGSKSAKIVNEKIQVTEDKKIAEARKASLNANRVELEKKIRVSTSDTTNIYLVTRALALGAIGAMISIFAKFLLMGSTHFLFEDRMIMSRMWASMVMGGIVAVVVVGLFLTGFISIFSGSTQNTGPTDFWKVTILCLFAGAFSDRLFQAAAGRMDNYLRTVERGRESKATRAVRASGSRLKRKK